ncbi:MAG: hypothetical protein PVF15_07375 [Candidatus Bathyarchaeota archaeon]|jgi:hypothetical protein
MISERTYLTILIVAFFGSALLLGLWLVPYEIIEYNLGVNLLTSSIFMVLTIVFLGLLFTLRERSQWRSVKDSVYMSIAYHMGTLFSKILWHSEDGLATRFSLHRIEDKEDRKKAGFAELCKLLDSKPIRLNEKMLPILMNGESLEFFLSVARALSDVEIKYSRYLSPQLTHYLMLIQKAIRLFEQASRMYNVDDTEIAKVSKIIPEYKEDVKKIPIQLVKASLRQVLIAIHPAHTDAEIEFLYS